MYSKYRGWDTNRKKMYSPESMGADELTMSVDGRGFVNVNGQSQKLSQYYPHILPMQFIGLHDMNSVEIYEGDIYREGKRYRSVVLASGSYMGDYNNGQSQRFIPHEDIAIVGNIHENPELLEK